MMELLSKTSARMRSLFSGININYRYLRYATRLSMASAIIVTLCVVPPVADVMLHLNWMFVTVCLIAEMNVGDTVNKSINRSIGTILGAIYSESLIALLPAGPWYNHAMFVIMVVLAVFVTSYAQGLPALKSKAYAITLFKVTVGICGVADFLSHKGSGSVRGAAWRVANIVMGGMVMVAVDRIPGIRDWAADDLRALTVKTLTDTAMVVKETADSNAYGFVADKPAGGAHTAGDKPDGAVCLPRTETLKVVEGDNGAWHILSGLQRGASSKAEPIDIDIQDTVFDLDLDDPNELAQALHGQLGKTERVYKIFREIAASAARGEALAQAMRNEVRILNPSTGGRLVGRVDPRPYTEICYYTRKCARCVVSVCSVLDSLYTDKESASVYVNADTRLHLAGLMDIVGSFEDVYSELADCCWARTVCDTDAMKVDVDVLLRGVHDHMDKLARGLVERSSVFQEFLVRTKRKGGDPSRGIGPKLATDPYLATLNVTQTTYHLLYLMGEYLKSVMAAIERLQFAENWSVPHGHTATSFISTDGLRATAGSTVESLPAVEDKPDKPAAARTESEVSRASALRRATVDQILSLEQLKAVALHEPSPLAPAAPAANRAARGSGARPSLRLTDSEYRRRQSIMSVAAEVAQGIAK